MNNFFSGLVVLAGLLFSPILKGQSVSCPVQADLSIYGVSGPQMPFWFRTNQWGTVPTYSPAASLQLAVSKPYKPDDSLQTPKFDWAFGIAVVGNLSQAPIQTNRQLLLPEAYLKIRFGQFELWGGRRRQITGLVDSVLSSGSYAVSGNALPITQIQLALPDFLPLRFLRNVVAIKGNFTHGWFKVPYIHGVNLHQKAVFLRFGRPASRLHGLLGLNHEVQWGGYADYLKNSPYAVDGRLTTDLGDYLKSVVLGIIPRDLGNVRYTSFDAANRIGNHLGSMDVGVNLLNPKASWLFYLQHPFDDSSGLSWRNFPDGLYGVRWLNRQNNQNRTTFWRWCRLVGEVIITKDQSGPYFSAPGQSFRGADNYYNHSQYIRGWSYYDQTVGTPFIMPRATLVSTLAEGEYYFPNNRVVAYYTAFEALIKNRIRITGRFSYSQNFGTYSTPYLAKKHQFSGFIGSNIPLPSLANSSLSVAIAMDNGQMLTTGTGVRIGLHKQW